MKQKEQTPLEFVSSESL